MSSGNIYRDGTYLERHPGWHQEDSSWKAKQILKILRKNSVAPSTLCEIGCGAGEILNCLSHEYGDEVVFSGYEISPQAFAICKNKEKKNLHFFLQNLLDFEDPAFDVLLAIDVFEHVEDYFGFLRELRKKAKYKLFHIPLDLSVQSVSRLSPILHSRSSVGHIHYFIKETALATLQDTGYDVVDYCYTNSSLELSNRGWKADLMKVPRKLFFKVHPDLAVRVLGGFSLLVLAK